MKNIFKKTETFFVNFSIKLRRDNAEISRKMSSDTYFDKNAFVDIF